MGNTGVPRPISRPQSGMDVPYQRTTLQSILVELYYAFVRPPSHTTTVRQGFLSSKKYNVWAAATKVCMSPNCHGAPAKEKRETR